MKHELQNGASKPQQFDEKIRRASSQNVGGLSSCFKARNVRQSLYYSFIPRRFLNRLSINMVP